MPNETKIEPALTAEEWAGVEREAEENGGMSLLAALFVLGEAVHYDRPHRTAALALHGQPFGFTREDVEACRNAANAIHAGASFGLISTPEKLLRLAERIEALLPPAREVVNVHFDSLHRP